MTNETSSAYEFGEFILIPDERLLLRSGVPVPIPPAEFNILAHLVRHPNTIIRPNEIPTPQTGARDATIAGYMKYHVAKLRSILGDDSSSPRFIRSVFGTKGYKFICPVKITGRTAIGGEIKRSANASRNLTITSNLFVPMYLGEKVFANVPARPTEGRWVETKKLTTEKGTLYVLTNGFGVWLVTVKDEFANLTDFAYWRRDLYSAFQGGQHSISRYTKELLRANPSNGALAEFSGKPGYVFAVNVAHELPFRNRETIRNAVQVLACPSTLVVERTDRTRSRGIENLLLQGGVPIKDLVQFGLGDLGFASWDSLSYLRPPVRGLESTIIEFEIATQALWWMARCAADVLLAGDPKQVKTVRKLIPELRRNYSRLKTIGPNETPSERTMIEAVLKTSRIDQVVGAVRDLHTQNGD